MTAARWGGGVMLFLFAVAVALTVSETLALVQHPGFARYCAVGHYPSVWRVSGRPAWATEERVALACALGEWARAEFRIRIEDE